MRATRRRFTLAHPARVACASLLACASLTACGATVAPEDGARPDGVSSVDASATLDAVSSVDGSGPDATTSDAGAPDAPLAPGSGAVLYLNFNGGASFTLEGPHSGSQVWVPAFIETAPTLVPGAATRVVGSALREGWQARRASIIEQTRTLVAAMVSRFDLRVVTERPAARPEIEIFVGGDDTVFGRPIPCTDRIGFAHLICGDEVAGSHRVGQTLGRCMHGFSDPARFAADLAGVSAHEMGHSLSLEHVNNPGSIMFHSLTTTGVWGAGEVDRSRDELSDNPGCHTGVQDNDAELMARLGPYRERPAVVRAADTTPPVISRVVPADGSSVPPGTRPCLVASDNGEIDYTYVEAYVPIEGADTLALVGEAGAGDAPYVFEHRAPTSGEVVYRFMVTDRAGNLTEVHSRVRIDSAAPAPAGCM